LHCNESWDKKGDRTLKNWFQNLKDDEARIMMIEDRELTKEE